MDVYMRGIETHLTRKRGLESDYEGDEDGEDGPMGKRRQMNGVSKRETKK